MTLNICGLTWASEQDCLEDNAPGTDFNHQCWNMPEHSAPCMCACGEAPPTVTVQNEDTGADVVVPFNVWGTWCEWHEDTDATDAEMLLYEDADGAIVCLCCGVNYNPKVEKD